jgi:hypothetical protein
VSFVRTIQLDGKDRSVLAERQPATCSEEAPLVSNTPRATLASPQAYSVPDGAHLAFRYVVFTTDGFMRGDVTLVDAHGEVQRVVARNVPVQGSAHQVRVIGDYERLFPEPIPVLQDHGE